jgi:hypothetical protein
LRVLQYLQFDLVRHRLPTKNEINTMGSGVGKV